MHIFTNQNLDELAEMVCMRICARLHQRPDSLFCIAGGETTLPVFRACISAAKAGKADFSQCWFVGLDEWVGLGREDSGSCLQMLSDGLFEPLGLTAEQVVFFDGQSRDLLAECQRIDAFIAGQGGLDLVVLGVGMNGHIGFNEPGADMVCNSHIEELDDVTRSVAPKYFSTPQAVSQGITLGLKQLSEAKEILLMVTGDHKVGVVETLLNTPADADYPASLLRDLPQTSFWTDQLQAVARAEEGAC